METVKLFTHAHATTIVVGLISAILFYLLGYIRSAGKEKVLGAAKNFFSKLISDGSEASSKRFVMVCSFLLLAEAFIGNQLFGYEVSDSYLYLIAGLAGASGIGVAHEGYYKSKNEKDEEIAKAGIDKK